MGGKGRIAGIAVAGVLGLVVIVGVIVVCWDWITGWWTPGWGNLFTIWVAALAIAVSAWFNLKTLRRARDQFAEARKDARTDKLRGEIIAYLSALRERHTQRQKAIRLLDEYAHTLLGQINLTDLPRVQKNSEALLAEHISDVYRRINGHALAILMLTDVNEIGWPVSRIQGAIAEEEKLTAKVIAAGIAAGQKPPSAAAATEEQIRSRGNQLDKQIVTELTNLIRFATLNLGGPGADSFFAQYASESDWTTPRGW